MENSTGAVQLAGSSLAARLGMNPVGYSLVGCGPGVPVRWEDAGPWRCVPSAGSLQQGYKMVSGDLPMPWGCSEPHEMMGKVMCGSHRLCPMGLEPLKVLRGVLGYWEKSGALHGQLPSDVRQPAAAAGGAKWELSPAAAGGFIGTSNTEPSSCLARPVPPTPPAPQVGAGTRSDRGGDGWLVLCHGQGAGTRVVPAGAEAARQRKPPARRCHAQPGACAAVWQVVFSHQCFWFFFFKSLQAKQLK